LLNSSQAQNWLLQLILLNIEIETK
jgi:hypothetical protein